MEKRFDFEDHNDEDTKEGKMFDKYTIIGLAILAGTYILVTITGLLI